MEDQEIFKSIEFINKDIINNGISLWAFDITFKNKVWLGNYFDLEALPNSVKKSPDFIFFSGLSN